METFDFLKESVRNLKTIGTITRSSKYLCEGMIKHVDFSGEIIIVELGAGDGAITKHILNKMDKSSKLFAFEVNEKFVSALQKINDERLIIINDSAENLEHHLLVNNIAQIDYVISAIPFVLLPDKLAFDIIENCKKKLIKGGLFIQVHYSLLQRKIYKKIFGNLDINFVPFNIPPAFVFVSQNNEFVE